jgi:hypothetical protein
MMHSRHVFVDLPEDRRLKVYRFRPPRGEAKGCRGALHFLGKSKLCSSKNAYCRCTVIRWSEPSSTRAEVEGPKLVTDLGRPGFDVVSHMAEELPDVAKPPSVPSIRTGTHVPDKTTAVRHSSGDNAEISSHRDSVATCRESLGAAPHVSDERRVHQLPRMR